MKPKRIRLSRRKGWRLPPNAVNVARPGRWGNLFRVGVDGTAAECVGMHRGLLAGFLYPTPRPPIAAQRRALEYAKAHIGDLRGKDLACWCPLDAPCHADTLLELANVERLKIGETT